MMKAYDEFERTVELVVTKGKNKNSTKLKQAIKDKDGLKNSPIQPYQVHKQNGVKNIGLLLEDLIVIDIDEGHAEGVSGSQSFNDWLNTRKDSKEIYNQVVSTMRVKTPSNGVHIYYFIPKGMTYKDIPRIVNRDVGIDILTGKYNYVPAPNTDRGDGIYELFEEFGTDTDKTPMIAPDWVFDLINYLNNKKNENQNKNQKRNGKVNRNHNNVNKRVSDRSNESKDMVMTENETNITRILHAMMYGFDEGSRNSDLMSIAGILLFYVSKDLLPVEVAMDAVENIGKKCTPPMEEKEIVSVWNSAFSYYN